MYWRTAEDTNDGDATDGRCAKGWSEAYLDRPVAGAIRSLARERKRKKRWEKGERGLTCPAELRILNPHRECVGAMLAYRAVQTNLCNKARL